MFALVFIEEPSIAHFIACHIADKQAKKPTGVDCSMLVWPPTIRQAGPVIIRKAGKIDVLFV